MAFQEWFGSLIVEGRDGWGHYRSDLLPKVVNRAGREEGDNVVWQMGISGLKRTSTDTAVLLGNRFGLEFEKCFLILSEETLQNSLNLIPTSNITSKWAPKTQIAESNLFITSCEPCPNS